MKDFNDLLLKAASEGNLDQAKALFKANKCLMQADIPDQISFPEKYEDNSSLFKSPSFISKAAENGNLPLLLFFKKKFGLADFHLYSPVRAVRISDRVVYSATYLNPAQTALIERKLEAAKMLLLFGLSPDSFINSGYKTSTECIFCSAIEMDSKALYDSWRLLNKALTKIAEDQTQEEDKKSLVYQDKFADILRAFTIENDFVLKYLDACVQELNERQRALSTSSDIAYTLCKEGFFLLVEAIHVGIKIQQIANNPIASENLLRFQSALEPLFALDVEQPILLPKTNFKNRKDDEEKAILHLFATNQERREYLSGFLNKAEMYETVEKMNAEAPKIKPSLNASHLFAVVNQPELVKPPAAENNFESKFSIAT